MKANSRNNTLQDTGHFRAQARLVLQSTRLIESILNPDEFETAAQSVFQYNGNASQIRGRFVIREEVYATLWPDENACPLEMRQIAEEEIQRPIHSKLKAVIATPRSLLGCETSKFARLAIRFPGGGGVTGKPDFLPWLYCADLEYAERRKMIVIDFAYSLMPEGDSTTAANNIECMWKWLLGDLPAVIKLIDPDIEINWGALCVFGVSWGGQMAIDFWIATPPRDCKNGILCIKKVVLRCPVTREYRREPGLYVGVSISQERANTESRQVLEVLEWMPFRIPRSGSTPPFMMYAGPVFSIAHQFSRLWKGKFAFQKVDEMSACPDNQTQFFIRHGDRDKHVSPQDSIDFVEVLRKWPVHVDFQLQQGKEHAWDSDEPLSDEMAAFLDRE